MDSIVSKLNEIVITKSLVGFVKQLIPIYEEKGYIPVTAQLLLDIAERIEFLEARQTELQEEGTKLVTERRELKTEIERLKALL